MIIFPILYLTSFIIALREILKGNKAGFFIFLLFGLSIYNTTMSVVYLFGFKTVIPVFQVFKEGLVLLLLFINIISLKTRPRFHLIDYLIMAFLGITVIYTVLPIGVQSITPRLVALKNTSFYTLVYFAARLTDIRTVYISKYFNYFLIITIAAGAVVLVEFLANQNLQSKTGYTDYVYYAFNREPSGNFGLSTTFESEGGYRRFASFFDDPIEHAIATILGISVILGIVTNDDNKVKPDKLAWVAIIASLLSIIFAFSRAPLVSYFLLIYIYGLLTKNKLITKTAHAIFFIGVCYVAYLFSNSQKHNSGLVEVVMNTIDFSNPSSVGHIIAWLNGVEAIVTHPFGLGMGASGRVGDTFFGETTGGENQYIVIAVQAGIITMLLYITIYIMFIKQGLKWFKILKGNERKLCLAVLLFKIGLFIPLFTSEVESSSYISYMNWFLSGLFIAVVMQPRLPEILPAV